MLCGVWCGVAVCGVVCGVRYVCGVLCVPFELELERVGYSVFMSKMIMGYGLSVKGQCSSVE